MEDLGLFNNWGKTIPQKYLDCVNAEHKQHSMVEGNTIKEWCPKCKIQWYINSSN